MKIKVFVLSYYFSPVVCHDRTLSILKRIPYETELYIIAFNEKIKSKPENEIDNLILVNVDDVLDFSAFFEAIKNMEFDDDNLNLFMNDTIFYKYSLKFLIKRFNKNLPFLSEIKLPIMAGCFNQQKNLIGGRFNVLNKEYVSTYFFVLNKDSIKIFKKLYNDLISKKIIFDKIYLEFLNIHLIYSSNPFSWGKSDNKSVLKKKKASILFEKYLSERIMKQGLLINLFQSRISKIKQSLIKFTKFYLFRIFKN